MMINNNFLSNLLINNNYLSNLLFFKVHSSDTKWPVLCLKSLLSTLSVLYAWSSSRNQKSYHVFTPTVRCASRNC